VISVMERYTEDHANRGITWGEIIDRIREAEGSAEASPRHYSRVAQDGRKV
jgi:hypothetical protein